MQGERLSTTAALAFLPAPSLSPGQERGCHYGEAAVSFPEPHRRGPPPFAPHPPRRAGLGFPPPEKAAPKVREGGQEGSGSPLVFFFGNPDQPPPHPHPLKDIKGSGISPPALWGLLFSGPSFSHPPPRPRRHRRQTLAEKKPRVQKKLDKSASTPSSQTFNPSKRAACFSPIQTIHLVA